jgi:membrane protein implicated in regulation of membrane protease activity
MQRRRRPWWVLALVCLLGLAALAAIILTVWKLPSLLYGDVTQASPDARLQAASGFRTALVAGLAGLAALGSLAIAARTYQLTQQGQVTDRYTKAIEQLGSDKVDVRLGGIYALERIAKDSAHDGSTIAEVLTAFIRGRAPWPPARPDQPSEDTPIKDIPFLRYRAPDVQAALTTLGRQPSMTASQPLNLSDTDLRRADLSNADLQAATLLGAQLQGANIRAAQLQRVDLRHAQLHGARANARTTWPNGFDWKAAGVEPLED